MPENSFTKDFKLLSDVRIIQRHPINSRISHQDWVHLFRVNIPLLYLVPHVPGSRSILHLQWVKHCRISVDRMLLKPLLIALADGFNNMGPQLAGNQTYRVFIRLIDPNQSLNLARAPPCFSGLPFLDLRKFQTPRTKTDRKC